MGIISINCLKIHAHHGVFEQEQRVGNDFEINISLDVPESDKAMHTDALEDTINYAEVIEIVKKEMAKPSKLIEAVAGRIQKSLLDAFPQQIAGGKISIAKLAPPVKAQLESVSFTFSW